MKKSSNNFEVTQKKLAAVSPTFCLAKWLQVTIDLQHGSTHSCHNPPRHKVPLEELEKDPSALHNTLHKKKNRKMMLEGKRPPECAYCWDVEDCQGKNFSDRIMKSSDLWSLPHLDKIRNLPWDQNVNPTYVEVSFGNECQFSCAYCYADISSSIGKEMAEEGDYPFIGRDRFGLCGPGRFHSGDGPYVEAFWKWWPSLVQDLMVLNITGGEPLLNRNTFKTLDFILENSRKELTVGVNSNLGVPQTIFENFLKKIASIMKSENLQNFHLSTSVDTFGEQAEYTRHGLSYPLLMERIHRVLDEAPGVRVFLMVTFNILSIPRFHLFLQDVWALKKRYGDSLHFEVAILKNPLYLSAKLITPDWHPVLEGFVKFMETREEFNRREIEKMRRTVNWALDPQAQDILNVREIREGRTGFFAFIEEYDRRKKRDFLQTFPELQKFYRQCSSLFLEKQVRGKVDLEKNLVREGFLVRDNRLPSISPTFCSAKWLQADIDLGRGTTRSCQIPQPHSIPLSELKENPAALHNTSHKKEMRKMMAEGKRPSECAHCWKVEDGLWDRPSDRIKKCSTSWSLPHLEKLKTKSWDQNVNPTFLEISFGHECEFSCAYCSAGLSTSIEKEMASFGDYPFIGQERNGLSKNPPILPYVEAFWKWWPSLVQDLMILSISGGEPLLNRNTHRILDDLAENPRPHLSLGIVTGLGVSEQIFEGFLEKMGSLVRRKDLKNFRLSISVDTFGEQAEYIRQGLSYPLLMKRILTVLNTLPGERVTVILRVTFQILSIPRFHLFLKDVLSLKKDRRNPVRMEINLLQTPLYLKAGLLPQEWRQEGEKLLTFMKANRDLSDDEAGFTVGEIEDMEKVVQGIGMEMTGAEITDGRRKFFAFITEFDRRKNRDFLRVFPELLPFYRKCMAIFLEKEFWGTGKESLSLMEMEEEKEEEDNKSSPIQRLFNIPLNWKDDFFSRT